MRSLFTAIVLMGSTVFLAGCTAEQQLESEQDELIEERAETQESIDEAADNGVITPGEAADIREERAETVEQAGEVAEAAGDVVEEQND